MAQLTMPDDLPDTALVADPACGSGRMLIAGIRRNRYATFVGTDVDLTCVHMTALNCLVRNANTYVIHGNSLSLETWGGFYVRRSPFGGELHRLTRDDTDRLIRLPFKPAADAATALTPGSGCSDDPGALPGGHSRSRRRGQAVHDEQAGTGRIWVLNRAYSMSGARLCSCRSRLHVYRGTVRRPGDCNALPATLRSIDHLRSWMCVDVLRSDTRRC